MILLKATLGDCIDRLTIMDIKKEKGLPVSPDDIFLDETMAGKLRSIQIYHELKRTNGLLWNIEDAIRQAHSEGAITKIVQLSKLVISHNKLRSKLKAAADASHDMEPEAKLYFGDETVQETETPE